MAATILFILRGTGDEGRKTRDGGPFLTGQKWAKKPPGVGVIDFERPHRAALNLNTPTPGPPDFYGGRWKGLCADLTGVA